MIGQSTASEVVQKALDGVWQRQKAISGNIANYETPGYKAQKVSFEAELKKKVESLRSQADMQERKKAIQNTAIRSYADPAGAERLDGNNVNLDTENIELARTQIQYQYLVRSMTDTLSRLRYAITEGRK